MFVIGSQNLLHPGIGRNCSQMKAEPVQRRYILGTDAPEAAGCRCCTFVQLQERSNKTAIDP
jgi:hypothetical protein